MSTNITVSLPPGSTSHGDPNLLCLPPSWTDLATFYGTNYLAHAATLIARPGQSLIETIIDTTNALFIPGSGMVRAVRLLIFSVDWTRNRSPLRRAAKAGALCMVVKRRHIGRATWSGPDPELARAGRGDWFSDHFSLETDPAYVPFSRSILGTCYLRDREQYCLIEVSQLVPLRAFLPEVDVPTTSTFTNSSNYLSHRKIGVPGQLNIAKILVSILQLIWGISTLYNARGNQIDLYGYGAFGLTVAPYAFMSFLNLLVSLVLPVHNNMYLVWTPDMKEAMVKPRTERHRAGIFYGMIASVDVDELSRQVKKDKCRLPYNQKLVNMPCLLTIYSFIYLLIAIIPLAIVGAFTNFRTGSDVHVDRAWILAWLIVGSASAILIGQVSAQVAMNQRAEAFQDFLKFKTSTKSTQGELDAQSVGQQY
ncbi:hypothetical protein M406DRAFT_329645 [Cryphonectria parasitica EP155]|uniref:Uncharacterized protein n=1 Tax=Cryphonectria parasitica (strain ATCC 38755 / EP155) TaxID=660469 RepID=A0A9P4Y429_CRYP1|nr:uncharacterized protein M406DRAFT_329645 [Cryphonectria parasitica EP155]KAF3765780.1 hypothetical protein M406DRAFT_329645 [Cryphonectria parasitica EP155]